MMSASTMTSATPATSACNMCGNASTLCQKGPYALVTPGVPVGVANSLGEYLFVHENVSK